MQGNELDLHRNMNAQADSPFGDSPGGLLSACLSLTDELLRILKNEAEILRRFRNRELLEILARKESLVKELSKGLFALADMKNENDEVLGDPRYDLLRSSLKEAGRINQTNHAFIEGSLSYYRDFIDSLFPPAYGPRPEGQPRQELLGVKGLTFRKEI
ncbi:MAG: hypothetical protein EHM36_03665 [Deltaproteobacteria bacterium]|nr:MAG: hypothetical protein EHM36_03665 [Deltaproteobacteria bacterium]